MKCAETAHLVGAKTACACVSSMKKQPVITVTTLTQLYTTVAIPERKLFLTPSTRSVARQPYMHTRHMHLHCQSVLVTVTSFKIFRVVPTFLEI